MFDVITPVGRSLRGVFNINTYFILHLLSHVFLKGSEYRSVRYFHGILQIRPHFDAAHHAREELGQVQVHEVEDLSVYKVAHADPNDNARKFDDRFHALSLEKYQSLCCRAALLRPASIPITKSIMTNVKAQSTSGVTGANNDSRLPTTAMIHFNKVSIILFPLIISVARSPVKYAAVVNKYFSIHPCKDVGNVDSTCYYPGARQFYIHDSAF